MSFSRPAWFLAPLVATVLLAAPLSAQAPPPPNAVLTMLTLKPTITRPQLMKVLPDEVRATLKLYLDGKIQQWYSRSDGKGVIFLLNCTTVEEAKALMDTLPFSKANIADFDFTPVGPLTPLRMLLAPPAPAPAPAAAPATQQ